MFPSENEARRAARIFAEMLGEAVALKRVADPEDGYVGQGTISGRFGVMAEPPGKSGPVAKLPARRP